MAGNANSGRREKPFLQALMLELKANGKDQKALRAIARKLIDAADEGKMDAIIELANRLDGKPSVQVDMAHSGQIAMIPTINVNNAKSG